MANRLAISVLWRGWAVERDRWPLWLPVALAAGIALYFALPFEPALAWPWVLTAAVCAVLALWLPRGRIMLALLAALVLGFAVAKLREASVAAPVLVQPITTHLTARLAGIEAADSGSRLFLDDPISGGFPAGETPARLRLSLRDDGAALVPGMWLSLTARLAPPSPPSEPGAADYGRAAFFAGVGASGFALGAATPMMVPRPASLEERITDFVATMRWRMTQRIRAALPGSDGAIASALITGMRGGIAREDEAALLGAGLAHVLAIAGLHMAMVGMGLFWLVRALLALSPRLALAYPIKKWSALAALAGAAFYLVVSGAAPPATRAFVMLAVGLTAVLLDRPALSMRGLGLAAAILLLWRPETLTEPGFQMSFAAVAALIAAAEVAPATGKGFWGHLNAIFVTSAVASLATLPFALFHFGRATHYAVLGNLVAMPVMGFVVMPLAALAVAAMPLGWEAVPLHLLGHGIDLMLWLGRQVTGVPGAVTPGAALPMTALVLMTLGGLWLAIWRRSKRWLGLLPIMAGMVVALLARGPDLLVAPDAQTVALRGVDGRLQLLGRPRDRFVAQDWLRRDGDDRPLAAATGTVGLRCDGLGCTAMTRAGFLAIARRPEALAEDCAHAAILVSAAAANCTGPHFVADGPRAAQDQGYAVWFSPALKIQSVRAYRGDRPWAQSLALRTSIPAN